jgi:TrmH family RNA methyltransferase
VITSRANSHVKAARALGSAKERKQTGLFLDEGEDALGAALAAGIAPVEAFVDDDLGSDRTAEQLAAAGARVLRCSAEVMAALSSLAHTSRAVGVLRASDLPSLEPGSAAAVVGLQLHGVSDPGNLGTLLRSAHAFGPAHVALAEGSADPLSPRALRAGMGAVYSVPVLALREAPLLAVVALDARGDRTLAELEPRAPVAFALGAERSGLPDAVTAGASAVARIPLAEGAESLNVAIAGALALYELRRETSAAVRLGARAQT